MNDGLNESSIYRVCFYFELALLWTVLNYSIAKKSIYVPSNFKMDSLTEVACQLVAFFLYFEFCVAVVVDAKEGNDDDNEDIIDDDVTTGVAGATAPPIGFCKVSSASAIPRISLMAVF